MTRFTIQKANTCYHT